MKRTTIDGFEIQSRTGNNRYPPGTVRGAVSSCGLAQWLLIRGKWHRWEGTGSQLIDAIDLAPCCTLDEWLEFCDGSIVGQRSSLTSVGLFTASTLLIINLNNALLFFRENRLKNI
jgi:hypothetical protein